MSRAFVQVVSGACVVVLPFLASHAPAVASGHRVDQVLRCSVENISGYHKFTRQKPMLTSVDRPIELQIKAAEYQAEFSRSGVSRAIPVVFTKEQISMSIDQGAQVERISINGKTMAFEVISDSPRYRLAKAGRRIRLPA